MVKIHLLLILVIALTLIGLIFWNFIGKNLREVIRIQKLGIS
jgi:hypothetical protein